MNKFFLIFVVFLAVQRISELFLAKRNEKSLKVLGGVEYDSAGYKVIVFMHIAFFLSFAAEYYIFKRTFNHLSSVFFIVFLLTQLLRYWAIFSLGKFWNTKIIVLPDKNLIKKGPYKYIRHPNYLAVIIEIALIPLIFSCYITSIIFSLINFLLLSRRVKIEERVLGIGK